MRATPGEAPLDGLARFINERTMLLLLDNFEHLVPAGPLLVDLLSACPNLTALVTSREVLRLRGEQTYPVPSLIMPGSGTPSVAEDAVSVVSESDAVRLFVDRARSVQPSFRLDASNVVAVADICVRLDGLPLAIELAAARIRHLAPEALRVRLEHRLPLLTGGGHDLPARQRSLRAAIAWSYDLLSESEQRLFRGLGVFVGGFTLEAAEAVCTGVECRDSGAGGPPDPLPPPRTQDPAPSTLDLVGSLVEKSLVVPMQATGDEPRFGMLETIREYALEVLAAAGEEAVLRCRHRDWCLDVAEEANQHRPNADQGRWLDRLEAEHNNMRAGLTWCITHGDASHGLRLGAALWWFWQARSHHVEGRNWYRCLLEPDRGRVETRERAGALFSAGSLAFEQSDYEEAQRLGEEALAIGRTLGLLPNLGSAHMLLGTIARGRGDYTRARTHLQASLVARRQLGAPRHISMSLGSLGQIALAEGDYSQARLCCEQALAIARDCGHLSQVANLVLQLGQIALEELRVAEAYGLFEESLVIARRIGDGRRLAYVFEGMAAIAAVEGSFVRCLFLAGAAEALREQIGTPLLQSEQSRWASRIDPARRALGEPRSVKLVAEGRGLMADEVITYALAGERERATGPV